MFFSIFRPHLNSACATFRVKRVNLHLRNDVRQIYIYKYENSTVVLASVGLAQARPNDAPQPSNGLALLNESQDSTDISSILNVCWGKYVFIWLLPGKSVLVMSG